MPWYLLRICRKNPSAKAKPCVWWQSSSGCCHFSYHFCPAGTMPGFQTMQNSRLFLRLVAAACSVSKAISLMSMTDNLNEQLLFLENEVFVRTTGIPANV